MASAGSEKSEEDWLAASGDLADSLGIDPSNATEPEHKRVFRLYLPVFFWLKDLLREGGDCSRKGSGPLIVAISAPQGCGKTTLVEEMRRMLEKAGHPCAVLSIDDFYLTRKDQDALAARHPKNPLLQVRGNAGTHDLALGLDTIQALKQQRPSEVVGHEAVGGEKETTKTAAMAEAGGVIARIPRYDKSAGGGRGDRAPPEDWVEVSTPPKVVLLEGWMLGFDPLPEDSPVLAAADQAGEGAEIGLREVNTFLRDYRRLHAQADAWLVLKTANPEMVFEWRAEAERKMRESGRPGMTEEEVADFCSRYMPAYRAYLPGLYEAMGQGRPPGVGCTAEMGTDDTVGVVGGRAGVGVTAKTLFIEVGRDRNPLP